MRTTNKKMLLSCILITIGYSVIMNALMAKSRSKRPLRSNSKNSVEAAAITQQTTQLKKLIKDYQKNKKDYYVNYKLGNIYLQKKKYSNAKFHYKNAMKLKPSSFEPRLALYKVYMAQKKYLTAEKYSKSVVKIDNYNYYGNLYLMYSYMYNGKYRSASEIAEKMLKKYPSDATFRENLRYSYNKIGRKKLAAN